MTTGIGAIAFALGLASCNDVVGWDNLPKRAPPPTSSNVRVTTATLSAEHTCAIVEGDGSARCWGRNVKGQLGSGDVDQHLTPVAVMNLKNVATIETGLLHTCATDQDHAVWCWGSNKYAALGRGTIDDDAHGVPERLSSVRDAAKVHCGMNFSCAETLSKTASCWGTNDFGQLGDGTQKTTYLPKPIVSLHDVVSLSTGSQHACAVATNDKNEKGVFCWGLNDHGQLGHANVQLMAEPTIVPDTATATKVFTGDAHTCAIFDTGAVSCWGANDEGQLGYEASADNPQPKAVAGLTGIESLGIGTKHTCAQKGSSLYCWGSNARGQLGVDPARVTRQTAPRLVDAEVLGAVHESSARGDHTCASRPDGALFCWGLNDEGQLGDGTKNTQSTPIPVRF